MQQQTVFISYRRALSKHLARAIYLELISHNWDVFLDVNTIDSGDFDRIILNQIGARAHFILLISKGSLERCANAGDWVLHEIEEAVRLNRNIVPIVEDDASFTEEISYLPEDLRAIIGKKNALPLPHFFFDSAMEMLRERFLKTPEYIQIEETPIQEKAEVQRRLSQIETVRSSGSAGLLPAPFGWIDIPAGKIETDKSIIDVDAFTISKYPVTNAQFGQFMKADGYNTERWWTAEGWQYRHNEGWSEPRYWNGSTQPVVGVSWFEAVAFCLWLSDETGENIMLPTEHQWWFAAQGEDRRQYPWGNEWVSTKCQNSVATKAEKTSPVTMYEGKGDSPFGVVDMVGNVWEWCLTDAKEKTNGIHSIAESRVLRGGSWLNKDTDNFRCDYRNERNPDVRSYVTGFRIARS